MDSSTFPSNGTPPNAALRDICGQILMLEASLRRQRAKAKLVEVGMKSTTPNSVEFMDARKEQQEKEKFTHFRLVNTTHLVAARSPAVTDTNL